jgi:ketosteroid isomerase-like protein
MTLTGALLMTLLSSMARAHSQTPDEAAVKTIVESVGALADTRNFEDLAGLYDDEVLVDYSSLSGQPAELKSPKGLMTEWASVLPGFDRTRHELSEVRAEIDGGEATATAAVTADHWIGDDHWQVSGRYDYRLAKDDGEWRITAMTFILEDEVGSRDVFGPAMEAAAANPPAIILRQQTRDTVLAFLEGLEAKDLGRVNDLWAEDAVQEMPYSPDGFPKRVAGREALIAHYAGWPENASEADFTSRLVFYDTTDPRVVFAEYHGRTEVVPTGRTYEQTYGGLFHVVDRKIQLFREWSAPRKVVRAI